MFVTNWISTTKIQKILEITNFFRHYFLSRTEVKMLIVLIAFCFWLLESLDISLGYLNYIPFYFIYNVLLRITLCFLNPSILLGVSLLILTIVFNLMVAIVINHYPRIMNVLFPQ